MDLSEERSILGRGGGRNSRVSECFIKISKIGILFLIQSPLWFRRGIGRSSLLRGGEVGRGSGSVSSSGVLPEGIKERNIGS